MLPSHLSDAGAPETAVPEVSTVPPVNKDQSQSPAELGTPSPSVDFDNLNAQLASDDDEKPAMEKEVAKDTDTHLVGPMRLRL